MLKKIPNDNIIEKATLTCSSFRREKNLNSFGNSTSSETRSNDSFYNKYNNLLKNIFPVNETSVKNTFNSANFTQSCSNFDGITGLVKKEHTRESSISSRISDLKFSMLFKQSIPEINHKTEDLKMLKSHSLKNKRKSYFQIDLKELSTRTIPIQTIDLNVNSTKNKLETLKVEMLRPFKTKSNNITTPKKKNNKLNNLREKIITGDDTKDKSYLNSGSRIRAQNIKSLINKNLFK